MGDYPKTKYPIMGGGSITVFTAEQEKRLGKDWIDNKPFHVTVSQEVPQHVPKRRGRPPKQQTIEAT